VDDLIRTTFLFSVNSFSAWVVWRRVDIQEFTSKNYD